LPRSRRSANRCLFSLSRLVKVTETGQVIYTAEKDACRAFFDPQRAELARGPKRNFQILDPLEFLLLSQALNLGISRWALAHGFRGENRTLARAG
jgi:hypothetical protein